MADYQSPSKCINYYTIYVFYRDSFYCTRTTYACIPAVVYSLELILQYYCASTLM